MSLFTTSEGHPWSINISNDDSLSQCKKVPEIRLNCSNPNEHSHDCWEDASFPYYPDPLYQVIFTFKSISFAESFLLHVKWAKLKTKTSLLYVILAILLLLWRISETLVQVLSTYFMFYEYREMSTNKVIWGALFPKQEPQIKIYTKCITSS